MKTFKLKYSSFDRWMYQNDAEILDECPGCLLDNYLIACKNGVAIAYETYVNCWSSVYTVKFDRVASSSELSKEWDDLIDGLEV